MSQKNHQVGDYRSHEYNSNGPKEHVDDPKWNKKPAVKIESDDPAFFDRYVCYASVGSEIKIDSRKRSHGSDESSIESDDNTKRESVHVSNRGDTSNEFKANVELSQKRKKKFRKPKLDDSIKCVQPTSENKPKPDDSNYDVQNSRMTKRKNVRFHPDSEFFDKNAEQFRQKIKLGKQGKREKAYSDSDNTDTDDNDLKNVIWFESMKSLTLETGGVSKRIKVLVEKRNFWNSYNCYANERNGVVVIKFIKLRNDRNEKLYE